MICEQYPPEARTHVYTDGSATYVFQNGGAGISIYFSNGSKETANEATRRHYSNYKALMKVIALAVDSKPEEHHSCFSHRYALQALTNNKLPPLAKVLQLLSNNGRVAIQWILTHCDVSGNEHAYKLTKEGASVSYQKRATITKAIMMSSQEKDVTLSIPASRGNCTCSSRHL